MPLPDISSQFSVDANGLAALKRQARANTPEGNKATARQFEALFLQVVLKSMRDATPQDGVFDSEQSRMYESLLDQQLAQVLATKGGGTGLAAMIEKQLSRVNADPENLGGLPLSPPARAYPMPAAPGPMPLPGTSAPIPLPGGPSAMPLPQSSLGNPQSPDSVSASAQAFVDRVWPHAFEASSATGIPAQFMVAQAALETGWGRFELRRSDGRQSFNLFGIKAGRGWRGATTEAATTEYVNGVAQKQVGRFRAYGSYAEAFRDYADLLASNPRYAGVVGSADAASFARGLQQAGYASDPMYAAKLTRIIAGNTLRGASFG